jgi:hypothetical protein
VLRLLPVPVLLIALVACVPPARDPDLNDDGWADQADIDLFLACLGESAASPGCATSDLDGSGLVDGADMFALGPGLGRPVCNNDVSICERRFDEVAFAGSHNAFSTWDPFGVLFNQWDDMTLQLEAGVRALMLDTYRFDADGSGAIDLPDELFLCHADCAGGKRVPLVEGLGEIEAFLASRPGEVVTLILEAYITPAETELAFSAAGLDPYVYFHDPVHGWPTLGEMVASGGRLVVLSDDGSAGPAWHQYVWDRAFETHFTANAPEAFSCEDLRGEPGADVFILNHFITLNTSQPLLAQTVNANPFLLDRAVRCWQCQGQLPNFPTVDFATTGDVVAAANGLNDLWASGAGAPPPLAPGDPPLEPFCAAAL